MCVCVCVCILENVSKMSETSLRWEEEEWKFASKFHYNETLVMLCDAANLADVRILLPASFLTILEAIFCDEKVNKMDVNW